MPPPRLRWIAAALVAAVATNGPAAFAADPIPVGSEITVSATTDGYGPRIAADAGGGFMVVWNDDDTAQAHRFHGNGNEFLPQFTWTPPGHEMSSGGSTSTGDFAVAGDEAGNFMLTWTVSEDPPGGPACADQCVYTRRNDAGGINGTTFLIRDSADTYVDAYFGGYGDDQISNPEIASFSNGDFIVMWEGYDLYAYPDGSPGMGSDEGVFARKTVGVGQTKGSAFLVADDPTYYQGQYGEFSGDTDAAGNFVIAFDDEYSQYLTGEPGDTRAQRFNDKGKKEGPEFSVSSTVDGGGYWIDLAKADDGTFMVIWADGNLWGRIFNGDGTPVTSDFIVGADVDEPPAITAAADSFVVTWEDGDVFAQRFSLTGTELSTEVTVATNAANPDIASAANGDFVIAYDASDSYVKAQRFALEAPTTQEIGIFGKALVISNKVPDDPEKNKIKWSAGGPEIVVPLRGTASDPRCSGDASGTVKATVRFFSPTSGHDSGTIPLPCQNWFALGSNKPSQVAKRAYRYNDSSVEDGACNSVIVKGLKSLKVKCKGSGDTTDLPYDLEVGTSEGTVHAVLTLGLFEYCSSFPPSGSDGSDGKKFKGKNAAITACPS